MKKLWLVIVACLMVGCAVFTPKNTCLGVVACDVNLGKFVPYIAEGW
jgi:hypothetical protein